MPYTILRFKKDKGGAIAGCERHNERKKEAYKSNPDIVAKILHSSPNYIYELIKKGKLKAVKLKSLKIRKTALEEFLQENEGNDLSDLENVKRLNGGE